MTHSLTKPCLVLAPSDWAELHDYLSLALDALGDRPQDFTPDFLENCLVHQRLALSVTCRASTRVEAY
jgi:hypothetical protein